MSSECYKFSDIFDSPNSPVLESSAELNDARCEVTVPPPGNSRPDKLALRSRFLRLSVHSKPISSDLPNLQNTRRITNPIGSLPIVDARQYRATGPETDA